MKSLINLCTELLADAGSICSVETERDLVTLKSRSRHEGLSFFTITLSKFSEDFERSLEERRVDSTRFVGWKKRGCLPAFLRGFTSLVFDSRGEVKDEPDIEAILCIRQICRMFKKVLVPCTDARIKAAFENYVQTETTLPDTLDHTDPRHSHFSAVSNFIWSQVFGSEFSTFGLVPKHGPGATAEKVSGNAKFSHLVWYERLESSFPVSEHYFTSVNHMLDKTSGLGPLHMVSEDQELPVRVIAVPKTLKAPRIIAIEPVCMQYTQQALSSFLMRELQRNELTRESIRFNDQTMNQRMALLSSADRTFATLDLSDASDRVPLSAVRLMLDCNQDLLNAVLACRSVRAQLPDGRYVSLKKFASMGSALCFPIESMYFFTIIVHSILWAHKTPLSWRAVLDCARRIYVYGDDIIVPIDETDIVIEGLTAYCCKVNATKSFRNGYFRESCGTDAYQGIDVTPVYLRNMCPRSKRPSLEHVSWVATSNQLHLKGWWRAANYMKEVVERQLGCLPVAAETSPGIAWTSFLGPDVRRARMCKFLHKPLVRTYKVLPRRVRDELDGYPALLKYFLRVEGKVASFLPQSSQIGKKHLTSSVRCGTVSRKRHWVALA